MKQTDRCRKWRCGASGSTRNDRHESAVINMQGAFVHADMLGFACPPTYAIARRLLLGRLGSEMGVVRHLPASRPAARRDRRRGHPSGHERAGQAGARPPPPLVMLDPGHGGKDPGAIGVSGTYEKHVALATAEELKRQLEATGHYRVALTRARDVFVPLDDRVAHAQSQGAALFVSMHADALSDHDVRGASVYTLSTTASDAQTAALAQRENNADRFGGAAWHNTSPEVARILASLVRQETRVGSVRLARSVVGSLDQERADAARTRTAMRDSWC